MAAVCSRLAISHYGPVAIEALVATPVLIAIAQRPLVAVAVLLAVVASVVSYGALPRVNLPGHPPVNAGDLCLAAAVGGTIWRRPWQTWPVPVRQYSLALITFLLLAGVATIKTSLLGSTHVREALYNYRTFMYLAAALTVAVELRAGLWRPFLNVAVGFATIVAILSIAAAASTSFAHFLNSLSPASVTSAAESLAAGPTARIRLEGLYFVYAMIIPTLVMILVIKDRWRLLRIAALVLMLGAIGVSLNRNMYAGALVGLFVTAFLGGAKLRWRIALITTAVAISVVLLVATAVAPAVTSEVGRRASTVLAPTQVVRSGSFQDRAYELGLASLAIRRHPWFGVGPSQPYGAFLKPGEPRVFVQDLYVYLATDYGIPTALAFLLVPGVCLWLGVARLPYASDPLDRALLAAAIGTLVALALSLLVGTYLQDPDSTAAFGVACGALLAATLRTFPSSTSNEWPLDARQS